MKIICLGSGNAFTEKNYNQSYVVEENGRRMLIDCGRTTPEAMRNANIEFKDINDVFISHAHSDHSGGLEDLAFRKYDWLNKPRHYKDFDAPRLITDVRFMKELWDHTLRGGLESMEGFVATLETFFEPLPVEANKTFDWEGWNCSLVQQIHIMSGSMIKWSFGLMMEKENHKTVYFTTDSQHCSPSQMEEFYNRADVIFQDTECMGVNMKFPEGTEYYKDGDEYIVNQPSVEQSIEFMAKGIEKQKWNRFVFKSGVHANFAQLAGYDSANSVKLSDETKAKMRISHFQDFVIEGKDSFGNDVDWEKEVKEAGFHGLVYPGDVLEI